MSKLTFKDRWVIYKRLRKGGFQQGQHWNLPPDYVLADELRAMLGLPTLRQSDLPEMAAKLAAEDPDLAAKGTKKTKRAIKKATAAAIRLLPECEQPYTREAYAKFITSDEWRSARYQAIRTLGNKCLACGRSPKDGVKIHVDHIEPCSKNWSRRLDQSNLQVLCEDCNLGKSNLFKDDWR